MGLKTYTTIFLGGCISMASNFSYENKAIIPRTMLRALECPIEKWVALW